MKRQGQIFRFVLTALAVASLTAVLSLGRWDQGTLLTPSPVLSQSIVRPQDVWQQVYQKLPNLPKENQYVNRETGNADPANTLVSRLIRYHLYVKGRPPGYRLDWKLTLADYLGANNLMQESNYPGYDTLKTNPLEGDRAAIGRLNRAQRDALVRALVDTFNAKTPGSTAPASRTPTQPTTPTNSRPRTNSPIPNAPRPGDAQLLLP